MVGIGGEWLMSKSKVNSSFKDFLEAISRKLSD